MKTVFALILIVLSITASAGSTFIAERILDGSVLSIKINDDLIPPFEAGEMWKIIKGNDFTKVIPEKKFNVACSVINNREGEDITGNCRLLVPFSQFTKIGKYLVFKAQGSLASRLNGHFIDSAYLSMQGNQVYLSSYNTRRLFYFGINEDLIH